MTTWTLQQSEKWFWPRCRAHAKKFVPHLRALAIGAIVGWGAWQTGGAPYAAIVFPMLIPLMRGRSGVYAYAFSYHAMTVYGLMGFAAGWFDNSMVMGAVSWVGLSLLAAAVWTVFNRGSEESRPIRAGAGVMASFVIALLPPFAFIVAGHPLVAWGYLLPNWSFLGVVAAVLFSGTVAGGLAYCLGGHKSLKVRMSWTVAAAAVLLLLMSACAPVQQFSTPNGVTGLDTYYGQPPRNDGEHVERYAAVRAQLHKAISPGGVAENAQIIVLPENTMNIDDPDLDFLVRSHLLRPLSEARRAAVVGKMERTNNGYKNQAALLNDGAVSQVVDQRQPAMLSMWRPWAEEHFPLDWTRDSSMYLPDGRVARVLICYEEYIPAIFLLDELAGGHDMAIIMSSNWSATTERLSEVQRMHSVGLARLFGRKVVRAVNYPRHWKPKI